MPYRKILCSCNGRDGSPCNRWLARIEGGYVWIKCPRCRGYHKESLVDLMHDLEAWLDELRAVADDMDVLAEEGDTEYNAGEQQQRIFGS